MPIREVRLKLTVTPQYLKMSIRDDRELDFQGNIDRVTQAFYHENPQDDLKHFGMVCISAVSTANGMVGNC